MVTLDLRSRRRTAVICAGLIALVWLVFGQTLQHGFLNYDDGRYVVDNPNINHGISIRGLAWAFTHFHSANWHPLTWISHMIDCQLFDLKAGGHHFTNVLLHSVAAVLLFLVLQKLTGGTWRCAFVAAVFAIHPLRVESVAWIAERKDALSGLFFMATLGAYTWYVRRPSPIRCTAISILFAFGLMSKPSLVTLPVVLLLLDYWPLRRLSDRASFRNCFIEKLPLFGLATASSIITVLAQREALNSTKELSITGRLLNAFASYLSYLWQTIWPVDLAIFYPQVSSSTLLLRGLAGLAVVILVTIVALKLRRTRPWLIVGWLWYLIVLFPMIGIVQVGSQAHADRYTYLAQTGIVIALTWSIVDLTARWRRRRAILTIGGALMIGALGWRAFIQTSYWKDNELLWRRTLAVTGDNHTAESNLGVLLMESGRSDEALLHLKKAVSLDPDDVDAHFNLANGLSALGRKEEAIAQYKLVLSKAPWRFDVQTNLANTLLDSGKIEEAISFYRAAAQREPASALAHYNLAVSLHRAGQLHEAIAEYRKALEIDPHYPDAEQNLRSAEQQR